MPKAKYIQTFEIMLSNNVDLFKEFDEVHQNYTLNGESEQENFNEVGARVLEVVREYEDKLCGRSEANGYGRYSGKLAEKFQNHIRSRYPHFDKIGIITFSIKKISL